MALIEEKIEALLKGRVKPKKGQVTYKPYNGVHHRLSMKLIARKAPEVMVKITGFSKNSTGMKSHFEYISRTSDPNKADVEIENGFGEVFLGKEEIKGVYSEWESDIKHYEKEHGRGKPTREVMNLVLSMPAGTDPVKVKEAVRRFASHAFSDNHEYVFALHTDEDHPHVHLDVKMKGYNSIKLNPRKADIQNWREGFAQELRGLGVVASATNRRARGITKKSVNSVVNQINKGDKTHKPRLSKVTALQTKEAVDDLISEAKSNRSISNKPWKRSLENNLKNIKSEYAEVIELLMATNNKEDMQLAGELKSFSGGLPSKAVTQNDDIRRKVFSDIEGLKTIKEVQKIKDLTPSR